jgi:hypothetical protein
MFRSSRWLLAALLLVSSCDTSPITRRIKLAAQPVLPSGRSEIIGSALRVEAERLEPLAKGSRYLVWAVKDEGAVPLGDFRGGSVALSVAATALHDDPSTVRSIRITEESTTALPDAPSGRVQLEGPLGGALAFQPMTPAEAANGGGEGRTEDAHLILRTSNLPPLPTGLSYAVWARFPPPAKGSSGTSQSALAGDDAGMMDMGDGGMDMGDAAMDMGDAAMEPPDAATEPPDAAAPGLDAAAPGLDASAPGPDAAAPGPDAGTAPRPDAGAAPGRDAGAAEPAPVPNEAGMVLLGTLDDSGVLDATFPYLLATAQEIVITVTSARAVPELVSPVRILRGELTLPAKSSESSPTHTH